MGWAEKAIAYIVNLWEFLSGEPREANTEGGIFPAIFGTVLLVFLMTIVVMPFGVMAAVYLREYAKQGMLVRIVRIAVNNLAGVPSIVFGVFGLGCFIYAAGGTIDRLFFPRGASQSDVWNRRNPLGLSHPGAFDGSRRHRGHGRGPLCGPSRVSRRIDRPWRHQIRNHLACHSSVRPSRRPDGLILAMARAAGEVAPLMLTGVVKLAPALPLDGAFPFLHLDRKFMHLGFHIYDVGFQSPNVEAAKPMVYMTTLTLIVVVVSLNLAAVVIRNRLRKRFATSAV